jgi:nucleotide-binding universal stress UspA family protein
MSITEVVVHVPVHGPWPAHVGYAARLAARYGAHLCGVFVLPALESFLLPENPQLLATLVEYRKESLARAWAASEHFAAFALALGAGRCEWRVEEGELAERLAHAAAAADLLVLGASPRARSDASEPMDRVVVSCRAPCLLIPEIAATATPSFADVVIGWNGSIEAWRSLRAALPFLVVAERVLLLDGCRDVGEPTPGRSGPDVRGWLLRHGVQAERRQVACDDVDAGLLLLDVARSVSADLLVMGAYGHARVREWLLGGATRHVLRHAPLPILMQH